MYTLTVVLADAPLTRDESRLEFVIPAAIAGGLVAIAATFQPVVTLGLLAAAIGVVAVWRWTNIALVGFFLLAPLHVFLYSVLNGKFHISVGLFTAWRELFLLGLLSRGLYLVWRDRGAGLPSSNADRFLLFYVLFQFVLFAVTPATAPASRALIINVEGPLIILMLLVLRPPRRVLLTCVAAIFVVVAVFSVGAIVEQFLKEGFQRWYGFNPGSEVFYSNILARSGYRSGSFFGDSLVLGFFLCGAVPFATSMSIAASARWRPLAIVVAILGGIATLLTYTRSAYAGVVVGMILVFALGLPRSTIKLALIGILLLSVSLPLTLSLAGNDEHLTHANTLDSHLDLLERDVSLVIENPLGYGLGSTDYVARRFGTSSVIGNPSADSVYFDRAIDGGLVALALYLVVTVWTAWRVWRARLVARYCGDRNAEALAIGAFAALVGVAVAGLLLPAQDLPITLASWGFAGLALAAADQAAALFRSRRASAPA